MRPDTSWFRQRAWGVFIHYLGEKGLSAGEWNRRVDGFDVNGLVDQLIECGAGYLFFTIGQNSGHYLAPNRTYDEIVGRRPSLCSHRDLIHDLATGLAATDIKLLVYLPSGAPAQDELAIERLGWEWGYKGGWPSGHTRRTGKRLAEFQVKWESVIREWSETWGKSVAGWWFDGCYFAEEMYQHPDPPNFESFAAAARAGNPGSIVAFNPGVKVPIISMTEHEDYTAGEISTAFPVEPGPAVKHAQYHLLSYLGESWSRGAPRLPTGFLVAYSKLVVERGGVVTWDVPTNKAGHIPGAFMAQLSAIGEACTPGNRKPTAEQAGAST